MSSSYSINRRGFVKVILALLGSIMGVIAGLPAIGYLISPAVKIRKSEAWIPVGPLENYEIGFPKLFSFTRTQVNGWEKTANSYGVYVLKQSENQAVVYSNLCTHLSCRVTWQEELQQYVCPCHDGRFGGQGNVIAGPPPEPLHQFETKLENNTLYIHIKEA